MMMLALCNGLCKQLRDVCDMRAAVVGEEEEGRAPPELPSRTPSPPITARLLEDDAIKSGKLPLRDIET